MAASNMLLQLVAKLQQDSSVAHGRRVLLDYARKSSGARLALLFLFQNHRRMLVLLERSGRRLRHAFPGEDFPGQERAELLEIPVNGLFGSALNTPGLQYIPDMYSDPRALEEERYWSGRAGSGIISAVGRGRLEEDVQGILVLCFGPEHAAPVLNALEEGNLLICISLLSAYLTGSGEDNRAGDEDASIEVDVPEPAQLISARAVELQAAIDQERSRIARDLHDGVAQNIAHVIHKLELVRRTYERQPQAALLELGRARDVLIDTLRDLRHGISSLLPVQLEEYGFEEAMGGLLHEFSINEAAIQVDYKVENLDIWPPSLEVPVYRLIQEALNNVRKHAHATHVTIRIRALTGLLIVQVSDNGTGFIPGRATEGIIPEAAPASRPGKELHTRPTPVTFGLKTMQERVRQAGGILEISSKPARGTTVKARFPLKESSLILTRREREVLQLLAEGATNRAIAQKLSVSIETVKSHVHHIMQKMQVKDRTQAAVVAMRRQWL